MQNQKWYYKQLGGHVHVRVFQNGGKCGDLCFTEREWQWFATGAGQKLAMLAGINFIEESPELARLQAEAHPEHTSWLIWSHEHTAWWKPNSGGYTEVREEAGRYTFAKAVEIVEQANRYCEGREPKEAMVWTGGAS